MKIHEPKEKKEGNINELNKCWVIELGFVFFSRFRLIRFWIQNNLQMLSIMRLVNLLWLNEESKGIWNEKIMNKNGFDFNINFNNS